MTLLVGLLAIPFSLGLIYSLTQDTNPPGQNKPETPKLAKPDPPAIDDVKANARMEASQYRAIWPGSNFLTDSNLSFDNETLDFLIKIKTEPGTPIVELYGDLDFLKNGRLLYRAKISEKPDVSFVDYTFVSVEVPYDDHDPVKRDLRFTKPEELRVVFSVKKVVFVDGIVKTFI